MYRRVGKRLFDIVCASTFLLLCLPLLIFVALFIRFHLGSPILFTQQRPGLRGKPFALYKFRSMNDKKNNNGQLLSDEMRLTRGSQWLRSLSLDELPELWNVIKGDMSLVGPRPLLMAYLPHYSPQQMKRHDIRPGITGWAQVNGRNTLSWEKKFEYDTWYVQHYSFWLDIKILFLTVIKIIKREGIHQDGHVTMTRFDERHHG